MKPLLSQLFIFDQPPPLLLHTHFVLSTFGYGGMINIIVSRVNSPTYSFAQERKKIRNTVVSDDTLHS